MNPPFAYPAIERFIDKLLEELTAGRVTEAVVLTNNFSDTGWFHKATRAAAATCITKGRVRFESPEGDSAQPTQGQTFFYFGDQIDRFREAFAGHGMIMIPDGGPRHSACARPSMMRLTTPAFGLTGTSV